MSKQMEAHDTTIDVNNFIKKLGFLSDVENSDWNRGLLFPDLTQECSGVETNPPSPDVDVYGSTGADQSHETGQDGHVMPSYPDLPGQTPPSSTSEAGPDKMKTNVTNLLISNPLSDPTTRKVVTVNTDSQGTEDIVNQGKQPRSTIHSYQSVIQPQHTTNGGLLIDPRSNPSELKMTQPIPAATAVASSAPVVDDEDSNDLDNINADELLPFPSYMEVHQVPTVDDIILKNILENLHKQNNKGMFQPGQLQTLNNPIGPLRSGWTPNQENLCQVTTVVAAAPAANPSTSFIPSPQEFTINSQNISPHYMGLSRLNSSQVTTKASTATEQDPDLMAILAANERLCSSLAPSIPVSSNVTLTSDDTTDTLASLTTGEALLQEISSLLTRNPETHEDVSRAVVDTSATSLAVKAKLQKKIQTTRRRFGQTELRATFENRPLGELTEDEKERIDRRKEMNRKSANESRLNRQEHVKKLKKFISESETENDALKLEIEQLNEENKSLRRKLGTNTSP